MMVISMVPQHGGAEYIYEFDRCFTVNVRYHLPDEKTIIDFVYFCEEE